MTTTEALIDACFHLMKIQCRLSSLLYLPASKYAAVARQLLFMRERSTRRQKKQAGDDDGRA